MNRTSFISKSLLTAMCCLLMAFTTLFAQNVIVVTDNQPYTEDFEGNGFSMWTVDTSGGGQWTRLTGSLSSVASFSYQQTGDEARLISPVLDLSDVSEATLSFSYSMLGLYSMDELEVCCRNSDTSSWIVLGTLSVSDYTNYFEQTYTLPSLSSTYQISFNGRGLGGLFLFVDNVEVASTASCSRPISLAVSEISNSSALLSWVATGNESSWVVELNGQETTVSTQPYLATGLTPQTDYTFRVKAVCDTNDESAWATAMYFTTLCDVYVVTDQVPYFDDFESSYEFTCWETELVSGSDNWVVDPGYLFPNNTAFFIWLGGEARLISVTLDITAVNNPALNFKRRQPEGTNGVDELYVMYRTSPADSWHSLGIYPFSTEGWETETIDLPSPSATYQIAFVGIGYNAEGIYVDDVAVGNKDMVGVVENADVDVTFSPNPTSGQVSLKTNTPDGEVVVYDMYGKRVAAASVTGGSAKIDLSRCANGVYIVRLTNSNGTAVTKLVKE
ncbi:MAG: T9SS type A sorting domain-containing protein [Bacteroidales bacterium]|nr:T9SS type A sorting domain-containing protein [Bacteroidales bacterium]